MEFKMRDDRYAWMGGFRGLMIPDTSQEVGRMESEGVSCLKLGVNCGGGDLGANLGEHSTFRRERSL